MILEEVELLPRHVVNLTTILFEFVGVLVILTAGARSVWNYIKHNPQIRLNLATGVTLGLGFKLGSEILRIVVIRELAEVTTMIATVALRVAPTFPIHWEIKVEEVSEKMQHHHEIPEKA